MTAFTADRAEFCTMVRKVATFVADRVPVPVLLGILLEVADDTVTGTATDYEATGRGSVRAEVEEPGRVLVDAERLARICRHLTGPTVRVTVDGAVAAIVCGPSTYRLLTMPEYDFPTQIPEPSDMSKVRPAQAAGRERGLSYGQSFIADFRLRARREPRATRAYEPADLQPGAWISWQRRTELDELVEVTGQVWATAPGKRAVWALVEGERPVRVEERTYGEGSWSTGDYRQVKRLEEVADPVAVRAAWAA